MSTNRNVANLSVAVVKTLVRMTPFAAVADMIDSAQEFLNLLADIKNNALGDPNAEMIRSLNSVVNAELDTIQEELMATGLDEAWIEEVVSQLMEAARVTIKTLAENDDALIIAVQQPEHFREQLGSGAAPAPNNAHGDMAALYGRILDCVAEEFLILAPWSANFDRVALADLLRCFPALTDQVAQLERTMNVRFDSVDGALRKVDANAAAYHKDLKDELDSIHDDLRNKTATSHATKLEDKVWGSRPPRLKHWIERNPTCGNKTLYSTIFDPISSDHTHISILIGHAGSGKTRLAATIADTCIKKHWSLVAWIDASARTKIITDLIAFGESLLNVNTDKEIDVLIRVKQVLTTFRSAIKEDCLFIFDNAETVDDLKDLLPDAPHTHTIITTRNNRGWDLHNDWNRFYLNDFTQEESCKYLAETTKDKDKTSANLIAEYLGNLPLAITQAADTTSRYFNSSLSEYFMALTSRSDNDLEDLLEPIEGDNYTLGAILALHTAVQTTLDRIQTGKIREEAIRILDSLCYLDKSGVPSTWLKEPSNLGRSKAYRALLDASIIEESMDSRYTTIHRLFGHAIRKQSVKSAAMSNACNTLANASSIKTPVGNTLQYGQQLRDLTTQVMAITPDLSSVSSADQITITTLIEEILWNCYDLSLYDYGAALYTSIEDLRPLQHNTETWIRILDHLGANLRALRKFADAHAVYDELFSLISTNHPKYYVYRSHLALLYYFEENDDIALKICKKTLAQTDQDDPYYSYYEYYFARITKDTINSFNMSKQEQYDQIQMAISHLHHAIEHVNSHISSFDKQFETHVFTELSESYSLIGEHNEAIQYSNKALKSAQEVLRDSHPDIITYRHNLLASKKKANGTSPELITDIRSLVKEAADRLSDSNPEVFTMRYNLARWLTEDKQYREAIREYDSLIIISESSVDSTFPSTERLREERNRIARL